MRGVWKINEVFEKSFQISIYELIKLYPRLAYFSPFSDFHELILLSSLYYFIIILSRKQKKQLSKSLHFPHRNSQSHERSMEYHTHPPHLYLEYLVAKQNQPPSTKSLTHPSIPLTPSQKSSLVENSLHGHLTFQRSTAKLLHHSETK